MTTTFLGSILLLLFSSSTATTTIERRRSQQHHQHILDQHLCTAVWINNATLANLLLQQGAHPDTPCSAQSTYCPYTSRRVSSIFHAAVALHYPMLALLLHHHALHIPLLLDNQGMSPLHYVVDPYLSMLHVSKCRLRGIHTPCQTLSTSPLYDQTAHQLMESMSM